MQTERQTLRLIILTHGGAEPLIEKLMALEGVTIAGVFVETEGLRRTSTRRERLERSIRYDGWLTTAAKAMRSVLHRNGAAASEQQTTQTRQRQLRDFSAARGVPFYLVKNYHEAAAIAAMRRVQPDLGIIWGTNILKEPVFSVPRLGSINLHQGLAPYYRGGPPVFWELYNGESELGITVHFVAPKVDTGDIIAQQRVPLIYDDAYGTDYERFIADFRRRITDRCAEVMTSAVRAIAGGTAQPMAQDISLGQRYRLPVKREKDELRRRLRERQQRQTTVAQRPATEVSEAK